MTDGAEAALRESLVRLFEGPRQTPARDDGNWIDDWPALAELGGVEVLDPEHGAGRSGLGLAVAIAEETARALHGFPAHAVLPASTARHAVAAGLGPSTVAGVVLGQGLRTEPTGTDETGSGTLLTGATGPVAGIEGLNHLLLVDTDGTVMVVDRAGEGVAVVREESLDTTRTFCRVRLDRASAVTVPRADGRSMAAMSRLLVAADTVAVTALAVERTVAYARERQAFGGPIGRHQAVQHRLVEHAIVAQQMGDLLEEATSALTVETPDAPERLAVLEIFCHERATSVISDCIQLTGAIGFTWEYGLHFGLRRAQANAHLAGGARRARRALAEISRW